MATAAEQLKLLEIQQLDNELGELRHRKQTDPSIAKVKQISQRLADLQVSLVQAKTAVIDANREVAKAQALVNEAQSFIARNQKKLDSGSLNHKDTLAITEEMSALVIRVSRFEDDLLEVMESQEACQTAHKQIEQAITDLEGDLAAATQERDDALAAIVAQGRAVVGRRDAEVRGIDAALLKRYDTIRSRLGGVGAVRLWGGRCEGCQMELPPGDLDKISRTAPDQVVLCEECGRILVRVPQ